MTQNKAAEKDSVSGAGYSLKEQSGLALTAKLMYGQALKEERE